MIERLVMIARWVGALAFLAVFATFVVAVFMRYAASQPIQWSDEFITIVAIWIVFWMSAFVMRDHEHARIDFIYGRLGPLGRRIMSMVSALLLGAIFLAALPGVIDYVLFLSNRHTDILEWRLHIVFMCMPLFFVAVVLRSIVAVVRLLSPSWRTYVTDAADHVQAPQVAA